MSDDLDLAPIEARYAADGAFMRGDYQVYRTDVATLLGEVRQLRADRDHARCWAHYHADNNPFQTDPPEDWRRLNARAGDGWYGASASFDAPDEEHNQS